MEFDNSFEVAAPVDETWTILTDIKRIAPCLPGAELTEVVDENTYKGKVSVRLGPVALTFAGQAVFVERDEVAHSARVKTQGSDSRGRGGANADVTFRLEPGDDGNTLVHIHTDLQLSGAVAQYGRGVGMITELSAHMIDQFAKNLHQEILAAGAPAGEGEQAAAPEAAPAGQAAVPVPVLGIGLRVAWNAFIRAVKRMFGAG